MKWTTLAVIAALSLFPQAASAQQLQKTVFAGGCFWCVEYDFDKIPGVVSTVSGFTGGDVNDPSYRQVTAGGTGHYEAVEITYDSSKVSYEDLLTAFWHSVDPTDGGGQFCDRGKSYETAVFVANELERSVAETSKAAAQEMIDDPIVTPILAVGPFYAAEEYHQDYSTKNPIRYKFYRWNCGRNQRVEEVWGEHAYEGIREHG